MTVGGAGNAPAPGPPSGVDAGPDTGDERRVSPRDVSRRDDGELRAALGRWLAARLPGGLEVVGFDRPSTNGMSSDTVLVDVGEAAGGSAPVASYAVRIAPTDDAFPVFPAYDFDAQARVMRLVAERSEVPVPPVRWYEPSPQPLGAPFVVMDRIDGRVPPDLPPYTMGSWLLEASDPERAALQTASVGVVAGVHGVEATADELAFLDPGGSGRSGGTALRRHVASLRSYYRWACAGWRTPLLDRAFAWLEDHWPAAADAEEPVLCWGDARIGNIIYRCHVPVAVLDWEMAARGPRELDLGWMIFMHRFFQDLTEELGMAGLPTFLERDAVAADYTARTGHEPRDLQWFITYAAARHGVIMFRVMGRQVHAGQRPPPEDPEELVLHRRSLARMLDGTYLEGSWT